MAPRKLYVINPNNLDSVTRAIETALKSFSGIPGLAIECLTVKDGPPGILCQSDSDRAIPPLVAMAVDLGPQSAGFVIACFSDPGLHGLRERLVAPVLGIGECAMLTACTLGQRIGVIAISSQAIPRHLRYYGAMGLSGRIARERAIDLDVSQSTDSQLALGSMVEIARRLRDEDGADVIVMGCAGMAAMRAPLEDAVGLPVVEPCQAAVGMAIGAILSRW
jgi:allantoin racemase